MKILHISQLDPFYSINLLRKVVKRGWIFYIGDYYNQWKVVFRLGDWCLTKKI